MTGFPIYDKSNLPKVNAMREAKTQPEFHGIPIIHDSAVMYEKASGIGNRPASCYTCHFKNKRDETCALIGTGVKVRRVMRGNVEYWPCCGMHDYGEPNAGAPNRCSNNNPTVLGLIWINAPKPDQNYGGANCGGTNGGDDCDHYQIPSGDDKRAVPQGFCRVLRHTVDSGDICTAWWDDDILEWQEAQQMIQGPEEQRDKRKLVESIVRRSDDE